MLVKFLLIVSLVTLVSMEDEQEDKDISPSSAKMNKLIYTTNESAIIMYDLFVLSSNKTDEGSLYSLCNMTTHKETVMDNAKYYLQLQIEIDNELEKLNTTKDDVINMAFNMAKNNDTVLEEKLTNFFENRKEMLRMYDDFNTYILDTTKIKNGLDKVMEYIWIFQEYKNN